MTSIRILLVDDVVDTCNVIRETLDMELEDIGIHAQWTLAHGANEGRRKAREADRAGEPIDVAIVDLYLRIDSPEQGGAAVMRDVKNLNQQAYVLLVTGRPELDEGFRSKFTNVANLALSLNEIGDSASAQWRWSALAAAIKRHLIDVGRLQVGRVTYDKADVGIVSVLEDVGGRMASPGGHEEGARALRILAFRCLKDRVSEAANVHISFLAPGRSGASVCRLDISGGGEASEAFLLKFGFDRSALERELAANRAASRVLEQSTLMAIVGDLESHEHGFHAITAKIAGRAIPLRKWLADDPPLDRAEDMAEVVLLEQLEPFYREDGVSESEAGEWVRLSPGRRLRALAAIERYGGALGDERAARLPGSQQMIDRLGHFAREEYEAAGVRNLGRKVFCVRSFGDLHSGNILVQSSRIPRPVLIDASLYGTDHWSADNARLLVDLLLRVRHSGVQSMLWPSGPILDGDLPQLCPLCEAASEISLWEAEPTDAFLAHAVELLPASTHMDQLEVRPEEWHWEWHLGLAREFLRQATYEDLTPPRACLGLAAAGKHLGIASELA